jgi:hypothetical protein
MDSLDTGRTLDAIAPDMRDSNPRLSHDRVFAFRGGGLTPGHR